MHVLLDECLPRKLAHELTGHEVENLTQAGWSGVKNGELLRLAATRFDALVTVDRRFAEGQPVPSSLVLLMLATKSNRLESIKPLVPRLLEVLAKAPRENVFEWVANNCMNLTGRHVTALANDASAAPDRPASYAIR